MFPYSAYSSLVIKKFLKNTPFWENLESKEQIDKFLWNSMDKQTKDGILSDMSKMDEIHRMLEVHSILYWDDDYPTQLREIHDPPLVLFVRGNPKILKKNWVGIVGTRKASPVSIHATQALVHNFIPEEYGIASGLALGIDREAMLTSLENERPTLGVLGTSIEKEYPHANRDLYKLMRTSKNAILVSEYLPNTDYSKWTFPMRNRIITGLSESVFLMETPQKSGAMSSAHSAIQQNRNIYIFDHEYLFDNSGGRSLIEEGAERIQWQDVMPGSQVVHSIHDKGLIISGLDPSIDSESASVLPEWEYRGVLRRMVQDRVLHSLGGELYCIFRK